MGKKRVACKRKLSIDSPIHDQTIEESVGTTAEKILKAAEVLEEAGTVETSNNNTEEVPSSSKSSKEKEVEKNPDYDTEELDNNEIIGDILKKVRQEFDETVEEKEDQISPVESNSCQNEKESLSDKEEVDLTEHGHMQSKDRNMEERDDFMADAEENAEKGDELEKEDEERPKKKQRKMKPSRFLTSAARDKFNKISDHALIYESTVWMEEYRFAGILEILEKSRMDKTVTYPNAVVDGLVREFYAHLTKRVFDENDPEYSQVYVRGVTVEISPTVINKFFDRSDLTVDEEVDADRVASKITGKKVTAWGSKKTIKASDLTAKYAILHKIAITNWMPTRHESTVGPSLAELLYKVGENKGFNFGKIVFKEMLQYVENKENIEKKYLLYPSLVQQIVQAENSRYKRRIDVLVDSSKELTIDVRVLGGSHMNDLRITAAELREFKSKSRKTVKKRRPVTVTAATIAGAGTIEDPEEEGSSEISFLRSELKVIDATIASMKNQRTRIAKRLKDLEESQS